VEDKLGEEKLGKETHYKYLEHGLEVAESRYATKDPRTYKGRLHIMAIRTMFTVTFSEYTTRIRRGDTRRCGGRGSFHDGMAKIKRHHYSMKEGRGDLCLSVWPEWLMSLGRASHAMADLLISVTACTGSQRPWRWSSTHGFEDFLPSLRILRDVYRPFQGVSRGDEGRVVKRESGLKEEAPRERVSNCSGSADQAGSSGPIKLFKLSLSCSFTIARTHCDRLNPSPYRLFSLIVFLFQNSRWT